MYNYEEIKPQLFTDGGQKHFLEFRDKAQTLLKQAGAFRLDKAWPSGDTWLSLACADRMLELGELKEITEPNDVPAQHRVFVGAGRFGESL